MYLSNRGGVGFEEKHEYRGLELVNTEPMGDCIYDKASIHAELHVVTHMWQGVSPIKFLVTCGQYSTQSFLLPNNTSPSPAEECQETVNYTTYETKKKKKISVH